MQGGASLQAQVLYRGESLPLDVAVEDQGDGMYRVSCLLELVFHFNLTLSLLDLLMVGC